MPLNVTKELIELRKQARELGIKFHHRANANTIQELIDAHLAKFPQADQGTPAQPKVRFGRGKVMTAAEFKEQETQERIRNAGALKRIRVTCMNPNKRAWKGEMISVGSKKMGTFKKFIPFDGQPYHVPKVIYDVLKERECTVFYTEKVGNEDIKKGKSIKEFSIEDLPPLTPEELKDLEKQQALASNGL